jgi:pimeloyl-ACP methyl ester carboxylesterase
MDHPRWRQVELGGPLGYLDFGGPADGPLLVCLHGLGGSHLNWAPLAPLLTDHARVLALDLPAHGRTPAAGRSTHVRQVQRLVHRFLTEVAGGPAVLVGNSMGGLLAILQAEHAPASVSGLVLIDPVLPHNLLDRPNPLVLAAFATYLLPWTSQLVARTRGRMTLDQVVDQMLGMCTAHPERVPRELVEESVALGRERERMPGAAQGFTDAARSLITTILRPRAYRTAMGGIVAPVLMLHGAKDRLIPVRAARRTAQRHPDWQFRVHQDAGHVPQLEDPAWVAQAVRDWLETAWRESARREGARREVSPPRTPVG